MAPQRRIDPQRGYAALLQTVASLQGSVPDQKVDRGVRATAVRYALEELAARHPGGSVEVRVPPVGVTQMGVGPRHTRGTPPNVVEMEPDVFLRLASGLTTWETARAAGSVTASGIRANLADFLPLWELS